MNELEFTIPNFDKYNPRKDIKSTSWYRASNTTFFDAKFCRLCVSARLLWFYCLAELSRANGQPVQSTVAIVSKHCGIRASQVKAAFSQLQSIQMVDVVWRDADVTLRTNITRRTNETNETNETVATVAAAASKNEAIKIKNHWLIDLWNQFGAKLPKAHTPISSARLKRIQTRTKDRPDKEQWKSAIIRLSESNFANGLNDRAWVATFDFILQAESLDKILEGKYDNRRSVNNKERMAIEQSQRLLNGEL